LLHVAFGTYDPSRKLTDSIGKKEFGAAADVMQDFYVNAVRCRT
jgi:hypothetical protein